jgi:CheY-like chemotaxis protein
VKQNRGDTALVDKAFDVIVRNVQSQVKIIEDILDVSRIISGRLRMESAAVDVRAVALAAMEIVRPAARAKHVELTIELLPDVAMVLGDADRLQQVAWNLLSNAVKFSKPGGRVHTRVAAHDERVALLIADEGEGIDAAFLPHVFERFRQADSSPSRRHGGLGLGLAIVRHLVELHGGTVEVESRGRDCGAEFRVVLPRAAAELDVEGESRGSSPSLAIGGARVLVVDDDYETLALVQLCLTSAGANVTCVDDAPKALEVLSRGSVDVLVSDIGLPIEDGIALLERARVAQGGRAMLAVALSGYSGEEHVARARSAGYQEYLLKPVDPADLVAAVARLLG